MLQILEQSNSNVIATRAIGKLTKEDYSKVVPLVHNKSGQFEKIRWYFEMKDFEGWQMEAMWEDIKMDARHANDFDKVAMVGDKKWEEWLTYLMKPFTSAEVKYFDLEQKELAKQWIEN